MNKLESVLPNEVDTFLIMSKRSKLNNNEKDSINNINNSNEYKVGNDESISKALSTILIVYSKLVNNSKATDTYKNSQSELYSFA